ncbi:cytidine deaminase-like protein [Dichotomopilus funicola]|uniref:cytidine deaminase n=1 Tax=Dichotomopilus funicola TaxID=1934379 RepID=A0AAN6ZRN7_9PEZI|nr:cytidine deaminase-like protein [Dichotomopilus funicola]
MPPTPLSASSATAVQQTCAAHNLTRDEFHQLRTHAQSAKAQAYAPYSNFRVGAVLLLASASPATATGGNESSTGGNENLYIIGANVENASYPVTTCAERVAFGRAVVDGHRAFRAVAVATDADSPASPCGMCRQFIREFCELSTPIIMFDKNSNFVVMKLEELLPLSFGPDNLGVPDPGKPKA